jgi:large subunit ribosomal protein L25
MAELMTIAANKRATPGKGASRAVRRRGNVPAVVYGDSRQPLNVEVDLKELFKELHKGAFLSRLVDLEIDGKKERVLPRDVQFDPVTDRPTHVDFMRVTGSSRIRLMIPVIFRDQPLSPGLKRGGVLNVVRHEVEFYCRADAIPERISISVNGLDIGDSVHISMVMLPENVKPVISDRDFTIATIAAPSLLTEAEEAKPVAVEGVEGAVPAEGEGAVATDEKGKAAAPGDKGKAAAAPAGKGAAAPADKGKAGGDKGKSGGEKGKK